MNTRTRVPIINKHQPHLTAAEEARHGTFIQAGQAAQIVLNGDTTLNHWDPQELEAIAAIGEKAVDTMVQHNIALAVKIAAKFERTAQTRVDPEDITQNSFIGLMVAIKKFNPSRGVKFSTMAYRWIELSTRRGTNRVATPVMVPEDKVTLSSKIFTIKRALDDDGRAHPNLYQEIADVINTKHNGMRGRPVTADLVRDVHNGISFPMSLDMRPSDYREGETDLTLSNFVADGAGANRTSIEEDTARVAADRAIADQLSLLDARERAAISSRYGLPYNKDGVVVTREELRTTYKVSAAEERVIDARFRKAVRPKLVAAGVESPNDYQRDTTNFSF